MTTSMAAALTFVIGAACGLAAMGAFHRRVVRRLQAKLDLEHGRAERLAEIVRQDGP